MRPLAAAGLALLAGCTTSVLEPVPDPLPELLLDWRSGAAAGAFLGVKGTENDSGSLEDLYFAPGVRVVRLVENSPARAAGLRIGDVVLAVDGREVNDPGALDALVRDGAPGDRVALRVQRDDTVFDVPVELAAAAGSTGGAADDVERLWLVDRARTAAAWRTVEDGVQLVSAREDGAVDDLPLGSVVTAVDGERVLSDRELVRRLRALAPGTRVELDYRAPDGEAHSREVRLLRPETYVAGWSVPVLATYSHDPEDPSTSFVLIDLWVVSLFRYSREGAERRWSFLRFFTFSSGIGELAE